jgi:hypothetical protein
VRIGQSTEVRERLGDDKFLEWIEQMRLARGGLNISSEFQIITSSVAVEQWIDPRPSEADIQAILAEIDADCEERNDSMSVVIETRPER